MQNEISVDTARISTINSSEYSRPRDWVYQMGLDKQNMVRLWAQMGMANLHREIPVSFHFSFDYQTTLTNMAIFSLPVDDQELTAIHISKIQI